MELTKSQGEVSKRNWLQKIAFVDLQHFAMLVIVSTCSSVTIQTAKTGICSPNNS